jgi:hypothetical protein
MSHQQNDDEEAMREAIADLKAQIDLTKIRDSQVTTKIELMKIDAKKVCKDIDQIRTDALSKLMDIVTSMAERLRRPRHDQGITDRRLQYLEGQNGKVADLEQRVNELERRLNTLAIVSEPATPALSYTSTSRRIRQGKRPLTPSLKRQRGT